MTASRVQRLFFALLVAFMLNALTAGGAAWAATYYVATNGSDANPGTEAAPFRTFKKAIAPLQPGDTLYIRGGTYTEQIDLQGPNKSGTANGWIKIAGYPGETVIFQHQSTATNSYGAVKVRGNRGYFIFENFIIDGVNETDGTTWQIRDGNHHFILRNIEVKNVKSIGFGIAGHNIQLINCKIHDSPTATAITGITGPSRRYGLYISYGNNILIEGNYIYNQPGGGMQVFPGPIRNVVIRNNVVHHNNSMTNSNVPGILVWGQTSPIYDKKHGTAYVEDAQVYNNIVYSNCVNQPPSSKSCGGILVSGNNTRNVRVWNNTVYGNKGYGIAVTPCCGSRPSNTVIQNNISFGNTKEQIMDFGSNTTLSNNLTTDPQFVNAAAGDFGLKATSPAIDKGITVTAVPTDFTGKARPEGAAYDIGAFEGAGSKAGLAPGASPPPAAVPPAVARPPSTYNPGASLCPI